MKKFTFYGNDEGYFEFKVITGRADEVKALYKSLTRHYDVCNYWNLFSEFPKFNNSKLYGLQINEDDSFFIINSRCLTRLLMSGDMEHCIK